MARFCILKVCWSCVETRAYKPARVAVFRPWPKTWRDRVLAEPRFVGIFEWLLAMAGKNRFRPAPEHHTGKRPIRYWLLGRRGQASPDSSRASSRAGIAPVHRRGAAAGSDSRRGWRRIVRRGE